MAFAQLRGQLPGGVHGGCIATQLIIFKRGISIVGSSLRPLSIYTGLTRLRYNQKLPMMLSSTWHKIAIRSGKLRRKSKIGPYVYRKLDESANEIRIMTIPAGSPGDELSVSLETVRLPTHDDSQVASFEALSYAWGSLEDPVGLTIFDRGVPTGSLTITQNLGVALPYLRLKERERRLWIDAICVNQEDLVERSSQVKLMPTIFSQAVAVVIWLGLEDAEIQMGYELLNFPALHVTVDWTTRTIHPLSGGHREIAERSQPLPYEDHEYGAMLSVLRRSWFERLWTRQEVLLSRKATLTCGSLTMSWTDFRIAMYLLYSKPRTIGATSISKELHADLTEHMDRLLGFISNLGGSGSENLGHEIYLTRSCKCTDPRDRIYAVIGLLNEYAKRKWKFEPDYTTPTECTYEEASYNYMEAFRSLDLLEYCDIGSRSGNAALPTWVPDWDCMKGIAHPFTATTAGCTSWGYFQREKGQNGSVLRAKGLNVGSVEKVWAYNAAVSSGMENITEELRRVVRLAADHLGTTSSEDVHIRNIISRTLIGGEYQEVWDPSYSHMPTEVPGKSAVDKFLDPTILDIDLWSDDQLSPWINAAHEMCTHRALFVTDRRYVGLGPRVLKRGDRLCVLLGCHVLLALRPVHDDSAMFQVVGTCHIDSLRTGEAFLGPLPNHWRRIYKKDDAGTYRDAFLDTLTSTRQREDPRWRSVIGEDYGDRLTHWERGGNLALKDYEPSLEELEMMMNEAVKRRGLEWTWFDLV